MLKIKDNVDLKELEKFGFRHDESKFEPYLLDFQDTMDGSVRIRITNDRIVYPVSDLDIYNLGNENEFKMHDVLFDLIKADLVEEISNE